jgi:small basic protein
VHACSAVFSAHRALFYRDCIDESFHVLFLSAFVPPGRVLLLVELVFLAVFCEVKLTVAIIEIFVRARC